MKVAYPGVDRDADFPKKGYAMKHIAMRVIKLIITVIGVLCLVISIGIYVFQIALTPFMLLIILESFWRKNYFIKGHSLISISQKIT